MVSAQASFVQVQGRCTSQLCFGLEPGSAPRSALPWLSVQARRPGQELGCFLGIASNIK